MRLLVVRHAIAEDREAFARSHKDDAARPLTPDGRRKMARAAEGLKQLVPELDLLAASPYKRALETAEIIAHAYGQQRVERVPELAPGAGIDRVIGWLMGQAARNTVTIVGHEPDLSQLVCALLAGSNGPFLELRKGAACLLEFPGAIGKGAATLDWFLGPKHLRRRPGDLLTRPAPAAAALVGLALLDEAREGCGRLATLDDAEALHDFRVALRR